MPAHSLHPKHEDAIMNDSPFQKAQIEWLRARADVADLDQQSDLTDEKGKEVFAALSAATWKLIRSPANDLSEIAERARIVSDMLFYDLEAGEPADHHSLAMLATVVAEITEAAAAG
jgi:hypothetical protein